VFELLIAAALAAELGTYAAAECNVALERTDKEQLILSLRPACPIGYASTQGAVRELLAQAHGAAVNPTSFSIDFGRIERYTWLSEMLARQASSSRRWNLAAGRPHEAEGKAVHENAYVAAALRGMPEFTALFGRWQIGGISIEKVLVRPAAELRLAQGAPIPPGSKLPYDAILWVTLKRP
jgi:hypothetical protein